MKQVYLQMYDEVAKGEFITNDNNLYINYDRFIKYLLINKKQQMDKEKLVNILSLLDQASKFKNVLVILKQEFLTENQ